MGPAAIRRRRGGRVLFLDTENSGRGLCRCGRHPVGVGLGAARARVPRVPGDVHVDHDVLRERAHHVRLVHVHHREHAVAAHVPVVPVAADAANFAAHVLDAQPPVLVLAAATAAGRPQADRSDAIHQRGVHVPVVRVRGRTVCAVRRRPRVHVLVRAARPVHGDLVPVVGRVCGYIQSRVVQAPVLSVRRRGKYRHYVSRRQRPQAPQASVAQGFPLH